MRVFRSSRILFVLALAFSPPALAGGNPKLDAFEAALKQHDCPAIPYENLRKQCLEKQKAANAACHQERACDATQGEVAPIVQAIKRDRDDAKKTDDQRTDAEHRKSDEGRKPDNSPKVHEIQSEIQQDNDKIVKLHNDENEQKDKLDKTLSTARDADDDCIRADKDLIEVVADAISQAEAEDDESIRAVANKVTDALLIAVKNFQPKPDVHKHFVQCDAAWRHKQEFIAGTLTLPPDDDCKPFIGPTRSRTPERKEQRWCQFKDRNGNKYSKDQWSQKYEGILANKRAGGEFEEKALARINVPKNNYELVKVPGATCSGGDTASLDDGFIPDGVKNAPENGPRWGTPYDFVEVKGWADMSYTGNLKKMMEYVALCGGSITVVFRSNKQPPETNLTGEIAKRLDYLVAAGHATVLRFPPPD